MLGDDLIFISIAAYRDAQLVPTVEDLLRKADEPFLLRFGICWQHQDDDPPLPFGTDARFRILDAHWRDSGGACWARAQIMKLWAGEQYYLQVDSHCRFVAGWDTKLIRMMQQTGSARPILSTYAYPFTPLPAESPLEENLSAEPLLMAIETFTEDGIPQLKPLPMADAVTRTRPMPARFLAAGFLFAPGSFVHDVPYDPDLYFFGEEIAMTVRAFTHGYDLFHPMEPVAWHDYVRTYAIRHWDDHAIADSPSNWGQRDQTSRARVLQLLQPDLQSTPAESALPPQFGLGAARSLAEYEQYAGISFALRKIQDYTRAAYEPPNPDLAADWPDKIHTWIVRVLVATALLPHDPIDCAFWMVAIQNSERREIRRRDFTRQELVPLDLHGEQIALVFEIESGILPAFWTVWPFSRERGWLNKIEGTLAADDFAIVD